MNRSVFVQSEFLSDIRVLELEPKRNGAALRKAILALIPEAEQPVHVFIEDNDDEQALESLLEVPEGLRVHVHKQNGIDVTVRYAGRDVRRTFRPSATIERVKRWAIQELGISVSDGAELMLQISGTDVRPDADIHIGSLVKSPAKAISFDLVPSPRING